MFPELIELLLIGCSIELTLILRSKSNTSTPKNQLADILTKGNFTRDEWNHLLTLFNISHFSSTSCIAAMAKRAQQESGEGRVTAKSRPMMNLPQERLRSCLLQLHQTRGGPSYGYQDPERHVLDDRTEQPVEMSRSDYLQKDYGLSWSSQEWKCGDGEHDRSGQPDRNSWDSLQKVDPHREEYLLGSTAHSARNEEIFTIERGNPFQRISKERLILITEFVNKVRNQVRIRQKRMSSIAENCTEHSIIW